MEIVSCRGEGVPYACAATAVLDNIANVEIASSSASTTPGASNYLLMNAGVSFVEFQGGF